MFALILLLLLHIYRLILFHLNFLSFLGMYYANILFLFLLVWHFHFCDTSFNFCRVDFSSYLFCIVYYVCAMSLSLKTILFFTTQSICITETVIIFNFSFVFISLLIEINFYAFLNTFNCPCSIFNNFTFCFIHSPFFSATTIYHQSL